MEQQNVQTTNPAVLIIEDDPLLIKMYKTKFESENIVVHTANDGQTGLALLQKYKPNLVILDIMMPVLSGLGFLEKIKALGIGDVPVIVLSNLSTEDDMKKAYDLGAKEYLVKANHTPKEVFEKAKAYLK